MFFMGAMPERKVDAMSTQVATTETTATAEQTTEGAKPIVFDDWIATQEEPVKAAVTARFQALENTVKATRDERDAMTKQLRDLSKAQTEGSAAKIALDETILKL